MEIKKIQFRQKDIWIVIVPFYPRTILHELRIATGYICYISEHEPNIFFLGELLKNEHGTVQIFSSAQEAFQSCINYLKGLFPDLILPIAHTPVDLNNLFNPSQIERMKKQAGL
jgi:hypothetical protein